MLRHFLMMAAVVLLTATKSLAQAPTDDPCKTFYEKSNQVKEVFECKTVYSFRVNPKTGKQEINLQPTGIKHGLYTMYFPDGKLMLTGYFNDNKRTGTWKYYNKSGKITKTESYVNDKLVQR